MTGKGGGNHNKVVVELLFNQSSRKNGTCTRGHEKKRMHMRTHTHTHTHGAQTQTGRSRNERPVQIKPATRQQV